MKVSGITVGLAVVTLICGAGTAYVALGNTIPSVALVVIGTMLTVFFGLSAAGGVATGSGQ